MDKNAVLRFAFAFLSLATLWAISLMIIGDVPTDGGWNSTIEDARYYRGVEPNPSFVYENLACTFVQCMERPFPVLRIYTEEGRAVISRVNWLNAEFHMENIPTEHAFSYVSGQIRGRGNSSWYMFHKKPYRIRFDQARTVAGTYHAARNWVLIANHSDKTLMRNHSAYFFASLLDGMYYAPISIFVDVYLNGNYRGVYMLSDQQNLEPGRVQLTFDEDPAVSEFFLEFCLRRAYEGGTEGIHFITIRGLHYDIRYPRGDLHTRAHGEYVRTFLTRIEDLARNRDIRVFDYIHLESFVDFFIVQEWFKNQDVGFSSVFMQIRGQGENRRLEMGPVWDFDIAAGNAYYAHRHLGGYTPAGYWTSEVNRWYGYLMQMPTFFNAVHDRWREIRHNQIPATIEHINHMATTYQHGFQRNFQRWNIMGIHVWPNPRSVAAIDTFLGQVEYLVNFLEARALWLDDYFASRAG